MAAPVPLTAAENFAIDDATVVCGTRELAEEDRNTVVNQTVVF